jgi:hypothetical protein
MTAPPTLRLGCEARERDVDLAVAIGLASSPSFSAWLLGVVGLPDLRLNSVEVSHPRSDGRETDLLLEAATPDSTLALVHVENKIDVEFEEQQPEAYAAAVAEGGRAVLLAPRDYIQARGGPTWDARVSYEEVVAQMRVEPALAGCAAVLERALDRFRARALAPKDPLVSEFWHAYAAFVARESGGLTVKHAGRQRGTDADWPAIRTPGHMHHRVALVHKMREGRIDLQVSGARGLEALVRERLGAVLGAYEVVPAGKSLSIVAKAPPLDRHQPFAGQESKARAAVAAMAGLAAWYETNHPSLHVILNEAH